MHEEFIDDKSVCDGIIKYFKDNPSNLLKRKNHSEGLEYKQSTDIFIEDVKSVTHPTISLFVKELYNILNKYMEIYPYSKKYASFSLSPFNIQHYEPGESYNFWHTERDGKSHVTICRHLVFMLYCNDIETGGETEFLHQEYKCKPVKGKLVIWPTDWTFTHRGIPAPNEEKYIVTGWFDYILDK